ncbi:DUF1120 domain-containing protein [Burkholderia contaminans]|uniref:DUF1120 domain-containing protein n=1 Tax=Burkholderia contaminans TaxID=488447 RepID=UPI001CF3D261|nr:DUF1120 domain-containing protein [Burkholderia contaminans]MCA7915675.1 DUF1120 domain-containing protein [Burkholderia contaminans]UUX42328.1 DUF1120 domain-containing protein [Burkholderia contaminans]
MRNRIELAGGGDQGRGRFRAVRASVHTIPRERDIQMNLKQWCVLSMLACALSGAGVTSAAELSVNGHIGSGSACNVALGNSGVVDLGNLSRKDVRERYVLDRYMSLRINCQNPTKVGIGVSDNRKGTVPPSEGVFGDQHFGLGNPAIGSYTIASLDKPQVDGGGGLWIRRDKDGITWRDKGSNYVWSGSKILSWDVEGPQTEPVAFKTLTNTLDIRVTLRRDIPFTDEMEIDGSATLELVYL